jgi:hypothetical protein
LARRRRPPPRSARALTGRQPVIVAIGMSRGRPPAGPGHGTTVPAPRRVARTVRTDGGSGEASPPVSGVPAPAGPPGVPLETLNSAQDHWRLAEAYFRNPARPPASLGQNVTRTGGRFDSIGGRFFKTTANLVARPPAPLPRKETVRWPSVLRARHRRPASVGCAQARMGPGAVRQGSRRVSPHCAGTNV